MKVLDIKILSDLVRDSLRIALTRQKHRYIAVNSGSPEQHEITTIVTGLTTLVTDFNYHAIFETSMVEDVLKEIDELSPEIRDILIKAHGRLHGALFLMHDEKDAYSKVITMASKSVVAGIHNVSTTGAKGGSIFPKSYTDRVYSQEKWQEIFTGNGWFLFAYLMQLTGVSTFDVCMAIDINGRLTAMFDQNPVKKPRISREVEVHAAPPTDSA